MIALTLEDILEAFRGEEGNAAQDSEWREFFDAICQEAIRIGMELNNQYHTPEELREIMGRLTGKKLTIHSVCFHRSIQILGKISQLGKMSLLIQDAIFRTRAELKSGTAP